jgi:hypothetical protein
MKAIHLICRRDDGLRPNGLIRDPSAKNTWHSSCWALPQQEALSLRGGWIYLHPAKSGLSEMGGQIVDVYHMKRKGMPKEDGFVFVFESRREGREQKWRGADHTMAWTSGAIDASYVHEH